MNRLEPEIYLNDSIIDLALTYRMHHGISPSLRERIYIFSCQFLAKYFEGSGLQHVQKHALVAKWTDNIDLFSKDYIFVPINEGNHWSLACAVRPGNIIEIAKREYDESDDKSNLIAIRGNKKTTGQLKTDAKLTSVDTNDSLTSQSSKLDNHKNSNEIIKSIDQGLHEAEIINPNMSVQSQDEETQLEQDPPQLSTGASHKINADSSRHVSSDSSQVEKGSSQQEGIQLPCIIFMDSLNFHSVQKYSYMMKS